MADHARKRKEQIARSILTRADMGQRDFRAEDAVCVSRALLALAAPLRVPCPCCVNGRRFQGEIICSTCNGTDLVLTEDGRRIEEIRKRAEVATPGTPGPLGNFVWYAATTSDDIEGNPMWAVYRDGPDSVETVALAYEKNDADFAAAARSDVPWLLSRLTAALNEIERLKK